MKLDRFELLLRNGMELSKWNKEDGTILVACSGGLDSVALATALHEIGYSIALGHVNYQLRGEESEGDAAFVKHLAEQLNVPVYIKVSPLLEVKGNIQAMARDIRYQYFDEIVRQHSYQYIATAHHKNDQAETILANIIAGTGIYGLMGIRKQRDKIIRPFLSFDRPYIEAYAKRKHVEYRTDSSNNSNKYTRNKLRREIIPQLALLQPQVIQHLADLPVYTSEIISLFTSLAMKTGVQKTQNYSQIAIENLLEHPMPATALHMWLGPLGFNQHQVMDIFRALQSPREQTFKSTENTVIITRGSIYQIENMHLNPEILNISVDFTTDSELDLPQGKLTWKRTSDCRKAENANECVIEFPIMSSQLTLRYCKPIDKMLISSNSGKHWQMSKLLRDEKIPIFLKSSVLGLERNGEIVWVLGVKQTANLAHPDQAFFLELKWQAS